MKELTIEEKAQRYDEALVKAAKIHRNYKGRVRAVDIVIEEVFPELKESEDESIRKEICKILWDNAPYEEAQEYITWLEKQGKPTYNKGLSELLHKVICRYINDPNISYSEREIVSIKVLPYVELLEKQGECEFDCPQNHQDVNRPNGCIVLEDFNGGEGFYKVHLDYLNKKQVEEIEEMIRVWNKELKTSNENIKDCIGMCLTDIDEQRFKDYNTNLRDCLVWLEKQGEQKPVFEMKTPEESLGIDSNTYNKIVDECIYGEQKPADKSEPTDYNSIDPHFAKPTDKVESKFHEGDWVVHDMSDGRVTPPVHIVEVTTKSYVFDDSQCFYFKDAEGTYRKWTIEDAKPGDVLVNQNGEMPFIFKECKNNHIYCYCGYTNRKDIFFDRFVDSEGEELHWLNLYHEQAYPATKEQRDLLFQKIHEAGYMWDSASKQLLSLKAEPIDEQKSVWSEEDDKILKSIIINIENLQFSEDMREKYHHIPNANKSYYQIKIDWLKSIKDRVLPQPKQEWNGEDESYYDAIIAKLEVTREDALLTDNEMNFLKSLEKRVFPKSNWNEEDITRLKSAITLLQNPLIACDEVNDGVRIKTVDWLKSIEGKVLLQSKQEWSEEDERIYMSIMYSFAHNYPLTVQQQEFVKSFKERYTWKPSKEQLNNILDVLSFDNCTSKRRELLESLYHDLKKLI